MSQLLKLAVLLFLTAILATVSIIVNISQGNDIRQLKQMVELRETTWDKQVKFNEAVTESILEK